MNKNSKQNVNRTNARDGASDTRRTVSSGKRNFLRMAWVLALCLSITGWTTLALLSDRTSWIGTDGVLHEPLFGLIPISFFFLFVTIVLALLDMVIKLRKRL